MNKNITIVEIARESGVSISTVSRVLNGNVPVAEGTRKRVEAVIEKYNYSPNALARGLVNRQTMTLGVVVPDITNPYFSTIFTEIEKAAHEAGYSILLCDTRFHSFSLSNKQLKTEEDYYQMLLNKKVDGVLIIGGQIDLITPSASFVEALTHLASSVPTVVVGKALPDIPCSFIERDRGEGMEDAIFKLLSSGRKRIAFVGGEPGVIITEYRLSRYRQALEKAGISWDENLISLSDYYISPGYHALNRLLDQKITFDSVLAMNDNVAAGALRALCDANLKVPDDVAIISCDQFEISSYLNPRLSSIDRHQELLGQYVIKLLLSKIRQEENPDKPEIPAELTIRESC